MAKKKAVKKDSKPKTKKPEVKKIDMKKAQAFIKEKSYVSCKSC